MGAQLAVADLHHRRGRREVLQLPSLSVRPGGRLAVLGPNGSGKTTLLRLLASVERPTAGRVLVDGTDVDRLTIARRRRIAYVAQQPGLLATSVQRNVELPLAWRKVPQPRRRHEATRALERLGIAHLADRPAPQLSTGERQRVSLARALAVEPAVLLLDEPAAALDAESRSGFLDDLEHALSDGDPTVVHVSHRPSEAMRGAETVAVLVDGRVRQVGAPAHVVGGPADPTVARLVGYDNVIPARVGQDGSASVGGHVVVPTLVEAPGPGHLAVWADGVRLGPASDRGLPATVTTVTPGRGRWEVRLHGDVRLVAHLPLHAATPSVGDRVSVALAPDQVAWIPAPASGTVRMQPHGPLARLSSREAP